MTRTAPLLAGFRDARATFAWRRGVAVSCATFLSDVERVSRSLPDRGHVLNACADRYRFAVGVAAALVRGQVSLLPPSTHAATVRQLLASFPDAYCLTEAAQPDIDLPQTIYPGRSLDRSPALDEADMPQVPLDRTVACVFTSGSTGVPTRHVKRWGALVENVRAEAARLEGSEPGSSFASWSASSSASLSASASWPASSSASLSASASWPASPSDSSSASSSASQIAIVATVPPQHMYGFESSVVMAWQSGAAIVAERPFYPADIVAALSAIPGRRMLVTTPFHLRALLAESSRLPVVDRVLCATAPLSPSLALEAERRFDAPVVEVYGCTETGQLATRRPTADLRWQLLGDVRLAIDADGRATASGGHVEEPTVIADLIDAADDLDGRRCFHLAGRTADLVNIAGKRTSLGHLNVQLNAIEGVVDGVFVMPDDDASTRDGVTRLVALVVAPTLDAARLTAALRERIGAVFLPRPLHFVERLPRNATGKVTHASLQQLLASCAANASQPRPGVEAGPGDALRR